MGLVVGGVAVDDPVGDGDGAIGADREYPDELAEIGPVVLVEPESDPSRALGTACLPTC